MVEVKDAFTAVKVPWREAEMNQRATAADLGATSPI